MLYLFENCLMYFSGVIVFLLIVLYLNQNKLIYMPVLPQLPLRPEDNVEGYRSPADFNLDYEPLIIPTSDGQTLRGWHLKQTNGHSLPTIIFFQGNAGNIGVRLYFMKHYMAQVKANIVLVAYRGYSNSSGSPSEKGLTIDGKAIIDYVNTNIKGKTYVHGRSLGGAVALSAIKKGAKLDGLILENTFTNLPAMVDKLMPLMKYVKAIVLNNIWPSLDTVQNMKDFQGHILFISSMKDEIVPFQMMVQLYESCNAKWKTKYVIDEGDHNSAWVVDPAKYFKQIQQLIDQNK